MTLSNRQEPNSGVTFFWLSYCIVALPWEKNVIFSPFSPTSAREKGNIFWLGAISNPQKVLCNDQKFSVP